MSGINKNGQPVNVGDHVTIVGTLVSFTGTGPTAQVVVQTAWSPATFVAQANDMNTVDHPADTNHPCTSISGKHFGVATEQLSVLGQVTAVTGTGASATLTVTLATSQASISVPSGACQSVGA